MAHDDTHDDTAHNIVFDTETTQLVVRLERWIADPMRGSYMYAAFADIQRLIDITTHLAKENDHQFRQIGLYANHLNKVEAELNALRQRVEFNGEYN